MPAGYTPFIVNQDNAVGVQFIPNAIALGKIFGFPCHLSLLNQNLNVRICQTDSETAWELHF